MSRIVDVLHMMEETNEKGDEIWGLYKKICSLQKDGVLSNMNEKKLELMQNEM